MNAQEFVSYWKEEKESCLERYVKGLDKNLVSSKISTMNLSSEQKAILDDVLNDILDETFYTFLLGLDGSANISGMQENFTLYDENGDIVANSGELESEAYEQFMIKEEN